MVIGKVNIVILGSFLAILLSSYFYFDLKRMQYEEIVSFDTCVKAGIPVVPTYPEKCKIPGKTFVNPRQKVSETVPVVASSTSEIVANLSYLIEGQKVDLRNGSSYFVFDASPTQKATGTVRLIGDGYLFDGNGDKINDSAVILEVGVIGSLKKMYYLALGMSLLSSYAGTNAAVLDTAIASSSVQYGDGELTFSYQREPSSKVITKYFTVVNGILTEIVHK